VQENNNNNSFSGG
jgi:hypothetical protein